MLALVFVLTSPVAGAQDARESFADGLFRAARFDMRSGNYAMACPKLEESYRLAPASGTLLNLAVCHEKLGHDSTAWTYYVRFVETVSPDDERVRFARQQVDALAQHLPRLRILSRQASSDAVLYLDGVQLRAASIGVDIPVDAGEHHAEMVWSDGRRARATVEVKRDQREDIYLDAPLAPPVANRSPPLNHNQPIFHPRFRPVVSRRHGRPLRTAGLVTSGIGVLGLVSAAIFSAVALTKRPIVSLHCPRGFCDDEGLRVAGEARMMLRAADVGLVTGATGLLTGGVLLFDAWKPSPQLLRSETACVATFSKSF